MSGAASATESEVLSVLRLISELVQELAAQGAPVSMIAAKIETVYLEAAMVHAALLEAEGKVKSGVQ